MRRMHGKGSHFEKQRSGRGTFLPLTTIKPRSLGAHHYQAIKDVDGFLGIASELVSFQKMLLQSCKIY